MPYPRFNKLAVEKRTQLLESAAQEFARYGFADASVNRILDKAHMSKGAAYYYFEDKVDLFCTVIQYTMERLKLVDTQLDVATLTPETFWPTVATAHREPLLRSFEQPWLFAAIRAAGQLSSDARKQEPLATLAQHIVSYALSFVTRGQELGLIRSDVPVALLLDWMAALDHASDTWLLERWEQLDREAIANVSDQVVDAMRRVLAPVAEGRAEP